MKNYPEIKWIFIFFILIYIATYSGKLNVVDGLHMYWLTETLAEAGTFDIAYKDINQKYYIIYEPVLSIAAVPLYYIAKIINIFIPANLHDLVKKSIVGSLNCFITSGSCVFLYLIFNILGYKKKESFVGLICFGLGTYVWIYTKSFYREPVVVFFIFISVYFLLKRKYLFCGIFSGLAAASKLYWSILSPVFFLYILFMILKKKEDKKSLFIFFSGLCFPIALIIIYNYNIYGYWTSYGKEVSNNINIIIKQNIFLNLFRDFFGRNTSYFLYSPICILIVFLLKDFYRKNKDFFYFWAGLCSISIIGVANLWSSTWGWGTRYGYIALALIALPLVEVFSKVQQSSILKKYMYLGIIIFSIIFQFFMGICDVGQYLHPINKKINFVGKESYPSAYPNLIYGKFLVILENFKETLGYPTEEILQIPFQEFKGYDYWSYHVLNKMPIRVRPYMKIFILGIYILLIISIIISLKKIIFYLNYYDK